MLAGSVERLAGKPRRLVMTAAVFAVAGVANAAEVGEPQTRPMDAEEVSRMVRAVARAPSMKVEHTISLREPVSFPTRRPCFYARKLEPWTADLDSTWVARFHEARSCGAGAEDHSS